MSGLNSLKRIKEPKPIPSGVPTSAASSAQSTSANATAMLLTSPIIDCCACAAPATCCSGRTVRVAGVTAESAKRSVASLDSR